MKYNVDKLIASARAALGWPYVSPGYNNEKGIDCSGLWVKMTRDQGGTIYHGSNTIFRKYTIETGRITSENDLQPGMAVFKWKPQDTSKYPDGLGDFCHIGIVAAVKPLEIIHASSAAGHVTTDYKIGNWKYWGKIKDVIYPDGTTIYDPAQTEKDEEPYDPTPMAKTAIVFAENGKPVKVRQEPSTKCNRYDELAVGTTVTLDEYGEDWCKVSTGKRSGWYMMTKFLSFDVDGAVG